MATGIRNYRSSLAAETPKQIVMEAVTSANEHTDKAVDGANQHTDSQVAMVRGDLKDANKQISAVRDDVKGLGGTVTELFMKTEAELNASIGKVGKADPPERAKLQFSLWPPPNTNVSPLTAIPLTPDAEGVVSVDFYFTNTSAAAAEKVDFWIEVCEACVFVKEPPYFDKPPGTLETVRHRLLPGILNPGKSFEKTTILVKPKESLNQFQIAFRYPCETCGAMSPAQAARILLLPSPRPFMRSFQ